MAPGMFTCAVVAAQASEGNPGSPPEISIGLSDVGGQFTNRVFPVVPDLQREMLAIGLAAISTNCQVIASLDPDTFGPIGLLGLVTT